MFERLEVRVVENGIIVTVVTEDEEKEYVFDTPRKANTFIRAKIDPKSKASD